MRLLTFPYFCMPVNHGLTTELEKRMQVVEMRRYRRLLNISCNHHVTNKEVWRNIQAAIGQYAEHLTLVKKRTLRRFGHSSRSSGLVDPTRHSKKRKRRKDDQKRRWEDNIKEWIGTDFASSTRAAENRTGWKGIAANPSLVP